MQWFAYEELAWLKDKDNLPIWAGGRLSFDKQIKEMLSPKSNG